MEIIKEIKEAEKQAKEIVSEAKEKAAEITEQAKKQRAQSLEDRRSVRRETIEKAVDDADNEASMQASSLEMESNKICQDINSKTGQSLNDAVEKVTGFVNSLAEN
ncbi:MAG: hypothetical protein ACIAQZ_10715 [Sedimentisphaeraceae bacterium JB056]